MSGSRYRVTADGELEPRGRRRRELELRAGAVLAIAAVLFVAGVAVGRLLL